MEISTDKNTGCAGFIRLQKDQSICLVLKNTWSSWGQLFRVGDTHHELWTLYRFERLHFGFKVLGRGTRRFITSTAVVLGSVGNVRREGTLTDILLQLWYLDDSLVSTMDNDSVGSQQLFLRHHVYFSESQNSQSSSDLKVTQCSSDPIEMTYRTKKIATTTTNTQHPL